MKEKIISIFKEEKEKIPRKLEKCELFFLLFIFLKKNEKKTDKKRKEEEKKGTKRKTKKEGNNGVTVFFCAYGCLGFLKGINVGREAHLKGEKTRIDFHSFFDILQRV